MPVTETTRRGAKRGGILKSALFWLITALSVQVAGYALVQYFAFSPAGGHFSERLTLLQIHAAGGAVALLTGPWQFWAKFRHRRPTLHRWFGRIYLVGVLVGSIAGLTLATTSQERWATHVGFGLLAVVWLCTAWMAFSEARRGHFAVHRQWSVRNFSLTFAAVTLRMELPLLMVAGQLSFHAAYITVAWLSWIPNLVLAEWWLKQSVRRRY